MQGKLLLKVLLPANRTTYEFGVSPDLSVAQGAMLMSRILGARERTRYCASDGCELMHAEGAMAGSLLSPDATFADLSARNVLVDGSMLVLL